jgi:hypothetical protein
MLFAERHHKLGRDDSLTHDRAEDLLTSTVFQLLRYMPVSQFLALLRLARPVECKWNVADADRIDVECWTRLNASCCPDVLLRLFGGDKLLQMVLIEAKLFSGKSGSAVGEGPTKEDENNAAELLNPDQLVKYWQSITKTANELRVPRLMIYLTSHLTPPMKELSESRREVKDMTFAWLSWYDVWLVANADPSSLPAKDLAEILACRGFAHFHGFRTKQCQSITSSGRFFKIGSWFKHVKLVLPLKHHFWTQS